MQQGYVLHSEKNKKPSLAHAVESAIGVASRSETKERFREKVHREKKERKKKQQAKH